ncbi:MAG: bifunctional DNA primase/polymerase [Burkholderiales bacterium]|nr:bifunctional DNA primase/polymerase [Burkholderiales bacterium]
MVHATSGARDGVAIHAAIREAALAALARGWSVIPVLERAKRPAIAWREFQARCPRPAELEVWLHHMPRANIAAVTGAISGIVVVDVDPAHGGEESVAVIEREIGPLPATVESRTGGGGRHLYFAHPGGHVGNRAGILPGIDLRGDGGVIVLPPSIHPSGNAYAWVPGHSPDEHRLAPLPPYFLRHT